MDDGIVWTCSDILKLPKAAISPAAANDCCLSLHMCVSAVPLSTLVLSRPVVKMKMAATATACRNAATSSIYGRLNQPYEPVIPRACRSPQHQRRKRRRTKPLPCASEATTRTRTRRTRLCPSALVSLQCPRPLSRTAPCSTTPPPLPADHRRCCCCCHGVLSSIPLPHPRAHIPDLPRSRGQARQRPFPKELPRPSPSHPSTLRLDMPCTTSVLRVPFHRPSYRFLLPVSPSL